MKISFSTLGCPGWTWEDMLSTAKDLGYDGIELRGIGTEIYVPDAVQFSSANITATKERLQKLGIEIPILTSACYLYDKENNAKAIKEGRDYIDLASRMDIGYVRVLGDRDPAPSTAVDIDFVAMNLKSLAEYAREKKVTLLVETNGVFADSLNMEKLLKLTGLTNIAVLWDIHHTFRHFKESIQLTYSRLNQYIKHVHVKDSVVENGAVRYKMTGYGDVPVAEAVKILKNGGYTGFVSLEWVKRWCKDLEEPGIVFSQFANYMKQLI